MNRGIVMEITSDSAIVLTPDGEFVRIRTSAPGVVGQEMEWNEESRMASGTSRRGRHRLLRRRVAYGASAAVLMLLVMGAIFAFFRTPEIVAYVTMDVNPSVEMGLDARERVRVLRAVNPDAEKVITGIVYRGEPVENVMDALAAKLADSRYLGAQHNEIVIASVQLQPVDEQWESRVTGKIRQALEQASISVGSEENNAELTIETIFLPVEVRQEAEANGVSAGKMAFWLAAENSGHKVDIRQLQEDSVQQIAANWGGLKQVLDEGRIDKSDKESWKLLLKEAQQKKAANQANKSGDHAAKKGAGNAGSGETRAKDGKSGNGQEPASIRDDKRKGGASAGSGDQRGGKDRADKREGGASAGSGDQRGGKDRADKREGGASAGSGDQRGGKDRADKREGGASAGSGDQRGGKDRDDKRKGGASAGSGDQRGGKDRADKREGGASAGSGDQSVGKRGNGPVWNR